MVTSNMLGFGLSSHSGADGTAQPRADPGAGGQVWAGVAAEIEGAPFPPTRVHGGVRGGRDRCRMFTLESEHIRRQSEPSSHHPAHPQGLLKATWICNQGRQKGSGTLHGIPSQLHLRTQRLCTYDRRLVFSL